MSSFIDTFAGPQAELTKSIAAGGTTRIGLPRLSSQKVLHLPGKIETSRIEALTALGSHQSGRALMKRFMVRGHWRKANPSWKDQTLRWMEPFWKEPELAMVIEREVRMKP